MAEEVPVVGLVQVLVKGRYPILFSKAALSLTGSDHQKVAAKSVERQP